MENAAALLTSPEFLDIAISGQSDDRNLMTMERKGGVVNGLNFNAQLTVNPCVFSRLQSLINRSSGFCGRHQEQPVKRHMRRWFVVLDATKGKGVRMSRDPYVAPYGTPARDYGVCTRAGTVGTD
jgi:hypothetical protein